MNRRLLIAQFGSTTVGRLIAAGLQAISLVLVARAVSPSDFGLLSSVLGLAIVAQTVFDLGIAPFVLRERSADRESGLITTVLKVNNRLSVLLSICTAIAFLLLGFWVDSKFFLLLPLSVWMSSERNADVWLEVIFADGDWRINLSNLILRRLLPIPIFLTLRFPDVNPLLAYSVAISISGLVSSTLAHRVVTKRLPPPKDIDIRSLIHETWPYWLNSLATQARNFDVTFAAMVASSLQAGFYASANRLTSPLRLVPTSMSRAVLPAATRAKSGRHRPLYLLTASTICGMTLVYVVLFFTLPPILPWALGERYRSAVPALEIVLLGLPFAAASSLIGALLQGFGFKTYVAHSALVSTLLYLTAVMIGARLDGARGAAAALSISFVLQFLMVFVKLVQYQLRRHGGHRLWSATHAGLIGEKYLREP